MILALVTFYGYTAVVVVSIVGYAIAEREGNEENNLKLDFVNLGVNSNKVFLVKSYNMSCTLSSLLGWEMTRGHQLLTIFVYIR